MPAPNTDPRREFHITRLFNAPRRLVWEAFTDPAHLAHWWGPQGFSITTEKFDLRPGGQWLLTMHGPDGVDYANHHTFTEVVPFERLSHTHAGGKANAAEDVRFEMSVTFEDRGSQTLVTLRSVFPTPEDRDRIVRDYNAVEGAGQTLDRLAHYLSQPAR